MIARRFDELLAWQVVHELSVEVWKAAARGPVLHDFKFSSQIRDASDSPGRNIAEGFGRFNPTEFARFLDIARGSALETQSLLRKGLAIGYFSTPDFERLDNLASRGLQSIAKLQRYLHSTEAKRNAQRVRQHRHTPARPAGRNTPNDSNSPNSPNASNDPNVLPNDPNVPNVPNVPNDPNA
jgi:four helix bundle protein